MYTPEILASQLNALRLEMAAREPETATVLDRSIPGLLLCRDPAKAGPFPSRNPNRIEITENGTRLDRDILQKAIGSFVSRGISKFFFWLDPSAYADLHAGLLQDCGLRPFGGTRYYVLTRKTTMVALPSTPLPGERLPEESEPILGCYGDREARERYRETMGKEGFDHFVAKHEGRVVSTARLFRLGNLAYFCDGGTEEEFRGRGGQSSLIAARINRAAEMAATLCVVEVLALSTSSMNNLTRLGFEHCYERQVFEYQAVREE